VANLPLAFAELLGGGVLLASGLSGQPIQDVFAGKITLGTPSSSTPSSSSPAGGAPPAGVGAPGSDAQARKWVEQGLALAGVPATPANVATVLGRARQESGFNPNAINLTDSNAQAGHPSKGFLQTIDSTFFAYAVQGHTNIFNPVDNTAAAVRYMLHTYGHLVGAGPGGY
jgi:hypothetical protein